MPNKKSPLYNYKSPRDYTVFNMGNEASPPFTMKYNNSTFPFKSPLKDKSTNHAQDEDGYVYHTDGSKHKFEQKEQSQPSPPVEPIEKGEQTKPPIPGEKSGKF
jgi:hypothetical protein